jgi:hypothetical protein
MMVTDHCKGYANVSVMKTLQCLSVLSNHLDFSVIQSLQCFSVSLDHVDFLASTNRCCEAI